MNEEDARRVLGVDRFASLEQIRAHHRTAIRAAHPDVDGGSNRSAAEINQAFDLLRNGVAATRPADSSGGEPARTPPAEARTFTDVAGDTDRIEVIADAPVDLFDRLLLACDEVGNVTGYDRDGAVISALVGDAPGVGQLIVTIVADESSAPDLVIGFTLDAFGHEDPPPLAEYAEAIVQMAVKPAP